MTHIRVGNLTIFGSDNGLLPCRHQAIIRTNAGILLIGPLGTNFSEIHTFLFIKMQLKMSFVKWQPFWLGPNVVIWYETCNRISDLIRQCLAGNIVNNVIRSFFYYCGKVLCYMTTNKIYTLSQRFDYERNVEYWSRLKHIWVNFINHTGHNVQLLMQYRCMKIHLMHISWYIAETWFYRRDFCSNIPLLNSLRPSDADIRK